GTLGPRPTLELPSPEEVTSSEGLLAFRVEGRQAGVTEHRRVTGIEPESFANIWQLAGVDDPGGPERSFSFRRGGGVSPFLQIDLKPLHSSTQCSQEVAWTLTPENVRLQASAAFTSAREDLILLNWAIPKEVDIREITGNGVRSWSRQGGIVQIWLERGLRD